MKTKILMTLLAVLSIGLLSIGAAEAAVPAAATAAFSTLVTDVGTIIDAIWTVIVPVTVGFIIMGLFKRGAYTATS